MESLWGEVSQTCPCQHIFIVFLIMVFFFCGYYFIYLLVMGSSTYILHLFVYLIVRNICISCCGQTIPLYFQRLALCYFYLLQCEGGTIQLIK